MKIDRITGKKCLDSVKALPTPEKRIILFADFLPSETDIGIAACDLVVAAEASGVDITSATFAGESFAQVALSCRTPMHFDRAAKSIARMDLPAAAAVVIILDSFMRAEVQSTTRFRRVKERRRMLLLLAEILRQRPDAILFASGSIELCYLTAARILSAVKSGEFHRPVIRQLSEFLDGKLACDIGLLPTASNPEDRYRLLQWHSGLGPRRMTLQTLLTQAKTSNHEADLRFLFKVASTAELKNHPTIRWLRSELAWQREVHECPGQHRMLEKAQALAPEAERFNLPITQYMMHLHKILQLEREFPLATRSQAQTYLNWYQKRCFERVPARWVPALPAKLLNTVSDGRESHTRAERAQRILLAVLESTPKSEGFDTEMLAYLSGNPAGIGPSRFAILLAALCQVPVRLNNDKPVWKSVEIRDWFQGTACRLLPGCRQFSPLQKRAEPSRKTFTIYGIADGKTGLGANTVMAKKMAEIMNLPFIIRDLKSLEPTRNALPPAGGSRTMQRDVILHHVNADRIPLHVMSPELARRNDTFHIGFLLWELDRIPQAHRLGIGMLDEIWAPSRFVANIYSGQTSTPVHLVKKGLTDLEGLQKISAAGRKETARFTAMVCFDFHSSVERKNPLAAVRAFQIAFPKRSHGDCRLIVKTTPTSCGHWGDPVDQMGQIRRLADKDSRIEIIEGFVSQSDLWQMMNSADCLLSTHRAEGFGYIPAYALALGKPLVTTDYGGQRDFCDLRTSFPVAAPLVEVPEGHALYSLAGAKWADISPDAVAASLRQVYGDPEMAAARARCGQRLLQKDYSMAAYSARCRQRLEQVGAL